MVTGFEVIAVDEVGVVPAGGPSVILAEAPAEEANDE